MRMARRIAGSVALVSYLWVGGLLYLYVLPGAGWVWPPDFHLLGYSVAQMSGFVGDIHSDALDAYVRILHGGDRIFVISITLWLILMGWCGGGIRYVVAGLAVVYALVDLAENMAIYHFIWIDRLDPLVVVAASHLTMAKFAAFYLCALVLLVHRRRSV